MRDNKYRRAPGRSRAGNAGNAGNKARKESREGQRRSRAENNSSRDRKTSVVEFPRYRRAPRRRVGKKTPEKPRPKVGRQRVKIALALAVLVGVLLCGRAVYLTLAEGTGETAFAAEQDSSISNDAGGRGDILSADGRKLATSLQEYRLISTPYQIEDAGETSSELAEIIGPETGQTAEDIEAKLTQHDARGKLGGYSVVGSIEPRTAEKVRDLGIAGLTLMPASERFYPDGRLAGRILGYLGDYGEAFGGVESRYDEALKNGENVSMTIDAPVQEELEGQLQGIMKEHKAKSAMGLVMRVDDGAIVALANAPSFNNNQYKRASPELQRNRVLTDPYEPGSTFKPFTVAAAFEEEAISEDDTYVVPDSIQVADRVIHDSEPHETKTMQPRDILEQSSNVGMIQVAQDLGGEKVEEYIRRFGFGERTGLELWGEDPGLVPAYEDWSGSSIGNIPIGQGLTVTPLQLAAGYAPLINGGTSIEPYIVKGEGSEKAGERVISRETSDIVRGMLQNVVEKGSGHFAQIPGYTVGGKTGTSQKVDPETGAYAYKHIASFIGFAPASDPEYLSVIIVDEPKTAYWGEVVAAPAFHGLMDFTLGYYNVPPDRPRNRGDESGNG